MHYRTERCSGFIVGVGPNPAGEHQATCIRHHRPRRKNPIHRALQQVPRIHTGRRQLGRLRPEGQAISGNNPKPFSWGGPLHRATLQALLWMLARGGPHRKDPAVPSNGCGRFQPSIPAQAGQEYDSGPVGQKIPRNESTSYRSGPHSTPRQTVRTHKSPATCQREHANGNTIGMPPKTAMAGTAGIIQSALRDAEKPKTTK